MAKLTNPYLLIGILFLTVVASGIMCNEFTGAANATNSINAVNGSTVIPGDLLIDGSTIRKEPIASNPLNIARPLIHGNLVSVFSSIASGAAPKDVINNNSYITADGHISSKMDGIGKVVMDEKGKIKVEKTDEVVWAYKKADTYAFKSGDSINFVRQNKTIKTIKGSDINNDSVPTDFVTAAELKSWFDDADDGDNITVDYYLGNFSDNRANVYGKDNITHLFGEGVYGYMRNYTPGCPVLVYDNNASEVEVSSGLSYVEYLAGYPTAVRAANAKEFAAGWNNTFIPPHGSAHGKQNVTFTSIAESEAPSGSAAHGVCPPGRSLRSAVLALGNPLPVGMSGADEAILYEYKPTIDVLVSNEGDYPIKIVMWTEGDSGDTAIYTKIYEIRDNSTLNSTSNSTNNTTSN
ncbi:hypothetical protein [Methanosphaera sp.]|uniref:hypothetical protein n=1 Tax=Methanosphaera sp. TaxID=2666342 RepID=UPI0025DB6A4D|nr:hypothetical protein [Methanosphaera sp.]